MKAKHIKRLTLKKTTLRVLTDNQLTEARSGAGLTALCTTNEEEERVRPDDPTLVQPLK